MKVVSAVSVVALALLIMIIATPLSSAPPASQQMARGKYLVEDLGTCRDCHTPRNERGEFIREKSLQGADLLFKPTVPIPGWTSKAPAIAGLPKWTREQAVKFFMTGITPDGSPANPPMPSFRLNHDDAEAVYAYLKSLKAPQTPPAAK